MLRGPLIALCLIALLGAGRSAQAIGKFPAPTATSFVLMNPSTGEVLAADDPDREVAPASLTKIMTALVVLDDADLNARYTVPPEAAVGGSSAHLQTGETIGVRDLLTGLLVASGNDAAVTLATGTAGSIEAFVERMNAKARALGLKNTHFENPHGLDEPGHHTTADDLVTIARAAMRHPLFRELVAHRRTTIPGPGGVGERNLESNNLLLDLMPEADGVKTGMTDDAGHTLVAHARRPALGVQLYAAIMGSPSSEQRARDAAALLRWGFAQYARPMVVAPGTVIGTVPVKYRPGSGVAYRVERGIRPPIRLGEPLSERIVAPREIRGPIRAGDPVGTLTILQGNHVLARRDLVAAESASAPGLLDRVNAGLRALIP